MNNTINCDPREIAKFDTLADEWWDPQGPMKPLHALNPLRLDYIVQHVPIKNKKVLDIGCGAGILTEALAIEQAIVTGIDLSPNAIAAAKSHAQSNQLTIDYHCIATENFMETHENTFDVITCMEMLEHVPQPESILQAVSHLLKPNGHAFFSTINRNFTSFVSAIIGAEYILKLLPKGTHDYKKFIKPSEFNKLASAHKLFLQDMLGITYNPLKQQFYTTKKVDVNYLIYFKKE